MTIAVWRRDACSHARADVLGGSVLARVIALSEAGDLARAIALALTDREKRAWRST